MIWIIVEASGNIHHPQGVAEMSPKIGLLQWTQFQIGTMCEARFVNSINNSWTMCSRKIRKHRQTAGYYCHCSVFTAACYIIWPWAVSTIDQSRLSWNIRGLHFHEYLSSICLQWLVVCLPFYLPVTLHHKHHRNSLRFAKKGSKNPLLNVQICTEFWWIESEWRLTNEG